MAKIIYDKDTFSRNIKKLLSEKKMNRNGLAKVMGISPSTIGRWIKKEVKANKINIHAIAHHFKVNIPWLLRGEGPKNAIEEETNSVEYAGNPEAGLLDECLEMCREILTLDRKSFFIIKASVEGVLRALKLKGQEGIKGLVERRYGEQRTITQPVELERRRIDRRKSKEEPVGVSVPD